MENWPKNHRCCELSDPYHMDRAWRAPAMLAKYRAAHGWKDPKKDTTKLQFRAVVFMWKSVNLREGRHHFVVHIRYNHLCLSWILMGVALSLFHIRLCHGFHMTLPSIFRASMQLMEDSGLVNQASCPHLPHPLI